LPSIEQVMPWLHLMFDAYEDYKKTREREAAERATAEQAALEGAVQDEAAVDEEDDDRKKKKRKNKKDSTRIRIASKTSTRTRAEPHAKLRAGARRRYHHYNIEQGSVVDARQRAQLKNWIKAITAPRRLAHDASPMVAATTSVPARR
jgi:hypothetical protein